MIIQDTIKGSELEISNESHVYIKSDSKDSFMNWDELDEETQSQLSELVSKAEGIMKMAKRILC